MDEGVLFRSSALQAFSISGSSEVSHDPLLQMHLKSLVPHFVALMLFRAGFMAQVGMSLKLCALAAAIKKATASRDVN